MWAWLAVGLLLGDRMYYGVGLARKLDEIVSQKSRGQCSALSCFCPLAHALSPGRCPSFLQLCVGGHPLSVRAIQGQPSP